MEEYTKGFKYRIYPNNQQKKLIAQNMGSSHFVYNYFLAVRRDFWKNEHKSVKYNQTSKMLTELKRNSDYLWLNDADSIALQQALRRSLVNDLVPWGTRELTLVESTLDTKAAVEVLYSLKQESPASKRTQ